MSRRKRARALFPIALAALVAKLSLAGCDDAGSYIFSGEQYDPVLQCLEPVSSIDVIAGSEPGSCGPVCILSLPQDGGQVAYVSTLCGPYPTYPFETDAGTTPLCEAALEAFKRGALCEDGGVVYGAGQDAGSEAGSEASVASEAGAGIDGGDAAQGVDTGTSDSGAGGTDGAADGSVADASGVVDAGASDGAVDAATD